VLLVCAGLEHARRGFESFARECFDRLRTDPGIRMELVKGSGSRHEGERVMRTLRRDSAIARALGRAFKFRPFRLEALVFAFSLQPVLLRRRPDVVYVSEWDTARALHVIRSMTRQRFKLLLCNGTLAVEGFDHLDRVQELTPGGLDYVIERGADPRRHVMLPLGFQIEPEFIVTTPAERSALRRRFDLPLERRIVTSVAALNRVHKRLDYLIEEVALLPEPRPFLLLLGEPDAETPGLRELARERLGDDGYSMRTVPPGDVRDLARSSDIFVLASFFEGLPRALIEASALGLPCLTHDYSITQFALGPHGYRADLRRPGALAELIARLTEDDLGPSKAAARHRFAYENFSWDRVQPRYIELLREVAALPGHGVPAAR
jgi:1,2-diacylglycerol 3-alpha-glucosyltransferase